MWKAKSLNYASYNVITSSVPLHGPPRRDAEKKWHYNNSFFWSLLSQLKLPRISNTSLTFFNTMKKKLIYLCGNCSRNKEDKCNTYWRPARTTPFSFSFDLCFFKFAAGIRMGSSFISWIPRKCHIILVNKCINTMQFCSTIFLTCWHIAISD